MRQLSRFLLALLFPLVLFSCKSSPEEPPKPQPSTPPVVTTPQVKSDTSFHFTGYALNGSSDLQRLSDSLGSAKMLLVLKLNRLDLKHCKSGDTLLLPSSYSDTVLSPFPLRFDSAGDIPKLLVVSRKVQAFAAYESGNLVRWGPTSTGKKKTPTPVGLYFTNWKKDTAISTVDPTWILPWCVNIENFDGVSFHQFDLPGYPASHSCIRLLEEDAMWIFNFAEVWELTPDQRKVAIYGTPVIIFNEYAFGKKPIWKKMITDPKIATVTVEELESVLTLHRGTIIDRKRPIVDSTVLSQ